MSGCAGGCGCEGSCGAKAPRDSAYSGPESSAHRRPRAKAPAQSAPSPRSPTAVSVMLRGDTGGPPVISQSAGGSQVPTANAAHPVMQTGNLTSVAAPGSSSLFGGGGRLGMFKATPPPRREWTCDLTIIPFSSTKGTCRSGESRSDPCGIRWRGNKNEVFVAYSSEVSTPNIGRLFLRDARRGPGSTVIRPPVEMKCAPPMKPRPAHQLCVKAFDVSTLPRPRPFSQAPLGVLRPYSEVEEYLVQLVCYPYMGKPCGKQIKIPVWDGDMVVEAYQRARSIAVGVQDLNREENLLKRPVLSKSSARVWLMDFAIRGASDLFAHYLRSANYEPRFFSDHDMMAAMSSILAENTFDAFRVFASGSLHQGAGNLSEPVPPEQRKFVHNSLSEDWRAFFEMGDMDLARLTHGSVVTEQLLSAKRFIDLGAAFGKAHLEEPLARLFKEKPPGPKFVEDCLQLWKVIRNAQADSLQRLWGYVHPVGRGIAYGFRLRGRLEAQFQKDWFKSMAAAMDRAGRPDLAWKLKRLAPP